VRSPLIDAFGQIEQRHAAARAGVVLNHLVWVRVRVRVGVGVGVRLRLRLRLRLYRAQDHIASA
jgi:hypothetical protein